MTLASAGWFTVSSTTQGTLPLWERVIAATRYKRGWSFRLCADAGPYARRLCIEVVTEDSTPPELLFAAGERLNLPQTLRIVHTFPVPRWIEQVGVDDVIEWIWSKIQLVNGHEAGEWFEVGGFRPFYPEHGAGSHPYAGAQQPFTAAI